MECSMEHTTKVSLLERGIPQAASVLSFSLHQIPRKETTMAPKKEVVDSKSLG